MTDTANVTSCDRCHGLILPNETFYNSSAGEVVCGECYRKNRPWQTFNTPKLNPSVTTCSKCHREFPVEEFIFNNAMGEKICRECYRKYFPDWQSPNSTIGPGQTEICQHCTEHLKHDVDHLIADAIEKAGLPEHDFISGPDPWQHIRELLKLRRGQNHGN
jgi:recombinational DNA repair protein (RecF pathway)